MSNLIKILHLEETGSDCELIKEEISKGSFAFEYKWVNNKIAFEKALLSFEPTIILSEYTLPFFSLREAMAMVRNSGPFIPFVLVTNKISEEMCVELTKWGVSDYLFKNQLLRLPLAILNIVKKTKVEKELLLQSEEVIGTE